MSNYLRKTKNPGTGKFEVAEWLDDYFGRHSYGVRFGGKDIMNNTTYKANNTTYKASDWQWEFDDSPEAIEEIEAWWARWLKDNEAEASRDNTEPTEVRSAEGSLSKSPTSIEEQLEQVSMLWSVNRIDEGWAIIHKLLEAEYQRGYKDGWMKGRPQ